jgi:protein-disulfide isomerase
MNQVSTSRGEPHRGTPTLFVNGRLHLGGYDQPTLGAALAAAIKER